MGGGEGLISLHAVWPSGVGVGLISNMLRRLTGMLFHPRLNSNSEVGISAGGDADTQSYSSEPLTTPGSRRGTPAPEGCAAGLWPAQIFNSAR